MKQILWEFLLKVNGKSNNKTCNNISINFSKRLIISTISYCKKLLVPIIKELNSIKDIIANKWNSYYEKMSGRIIKQTKILNDILFASRGNIFNVDNVNYELQVKIYMLKKMQTSENGKDISSVKWKLLARKLLKNY